MHKADVVTDQSERAALYQQASQRFYDAIPAIIFADVKAYAAERDTVQGFKLQFLGGQPFGGVSVKP